MTRDRSDLAPEGAEARHGSLIRKKPDRKFRGMTAGGGKIAPRDPDKIRYARAKFGDVVLVCTKCAKRQSLPKGAVRTLLKRALKERGGSSKGRILKPRLVEVGCLGPCPKRAVAVATTASLAQGRIVLVDPAGDRQMILDALLPDFGPKATLTTLPAPEDTHSGPPLP